MTDHLAHELEDATRAYGRDFPSTPADRRAALSPAQQRAGQRVLDAINAFDTAYPAFGVSQTTDRARRLRATMEAARVMSERLFPMVAPPREGSHGILEIIRAFRNSPQHKLLTLVHAAEVMAPAPDVEGMVVDMPPISPVSNHSSNRARIARVIAQGAGRWRSCSGCTDKAHAASDPDPLFQCPVGTGCGQCGGIGVIWDDVDWSQFAVFVKDRATIRETVKAAILCNVVVRRGELDGVEEAVQSIMDMAVTDEAPEGLGND